MIEDRLITEPIKNVTTGRTIKYTNLDGELTQILVEQVNSVIFFTILALYFFFYNRQILNQYLFHYL